MTEFTPPTVRHPFERKRVAFKSDLPSMTHQSHADSCDINKIIRRFDNTGELPTRPGDPQFADVTHLQGDLTEKINYSRETLDAAGRDLEAKKQLDLEEEANKRKAEAEELERLRELEKNVNSGSETS